MGNFIPYFHFEKPENKLSEDWAMKVVNYCYFNTNNRSLLDGKDIDDIEGFSSGDFPMTPYLKMFKSKHKKIKEMVKNNGVLNIQHIIDTDDSGLDWSPLPLIPTKLNSAIATVQKIPVEPTCKALDALAMKKKKEDIDFLKNKPKIEKELQDIADNLGIEKVDLGGTKNTLEKYSETPMGLDLANPEEEDVFSKMIYSLGVETAFEKALKQCYEVKKAHNVRLLEIIDHFKYGVSAHSARANSMTGLPDINYEFPGNVRVPFSNLPDYSDNTHRIIDESLTILDLFNRFSNEICDEGTLEDIIHGKGTGYCDCNGLRGENVKKNLWGEYKIQLKYIEVKSIDWVGVGVHKGKYNDSYFITDDEKKCDHKIWAQNTYGFWWLMNTKKVFGIHRLPYCYRTKGKETYQGFSSNIFKSQKKSAVELSIGENKKAMIADIKLQYAILKALPKGKYIDIRYIRNAITGLKDEQTPYTIQQLIDLAFEQNIMIGDTEGFDGKNDGQMKPLIDIVGGLSDAEVSGYLTIIANASNNISRFTGINEQLTGQSANPEGLVGLQKLLINSGLNALYYCNDAIRIQYESLFNIWGSLIQGSIEQGGKVKQAVINMIGIDDTRLLDSLNQTPLHNLTIKVGVGQREEERQAYQNKLNFLTLKEVITAADEYMLGAIDNAKERYAFLAVKEVKYKKQKQREQQEQYLQQQILLKQQGNNQVQAEQAKTQGDIQKTYAKGDVEGKIKQLSHELGLSESQQNAISKLALQRDRGQSQLDKTLKTLEAKNEFENQKSLI